MQSKEDQKVSVKGEDVVQTSVSIGQSLKDKVHSKGVALISSVLAEGADLYKDVVEIEKIKSGDPISSKVVRSYALGLQSKQLVLLYRDILFEIQKGDLLHIEGSVSEKQLTELITRAQTKIGDAEKAYEDSLSESVIKSTNAGLLVKQDHPWPIYESQLAEINTHLDNLKENETVLIDLSLKVIGVKEVIKANIEGIRNRFIDLESQAENILRSKDERDINSAIDLLTATNQSLDHPDNMVSAHAQIEGAILLTPTNVTPIVNINAGLLVKEDLSPQYQLEQWYDIEVLPIMEDTYQQIDTMTYNFRLALINISNRLELLHNSSKEFVLEDHLQPLQRFFDSVPDFRSAIEEGLEKITSKIGTSLTLRPLLSEDDTFLSLGFQSSINRFKKEQNLLLERLSYFWGSLKEKYFSIKSTVREESNLGNVEKVIRYIQGASTDRNNLHYNNFFNAKVSMVEAFWIGRELEQKRIDQAVKSWHQGFQGAILFYGDRYSGKSSLGDWVSQQYFRGKTYELKPDRFIMISKSKIDLTDDLVESIRSFIERVQYAKPMIWIDDLELWFDDQHLSDEVVTKLVNLIIEYGKKVFFVVSVGSWMYDRLSRVVDLNHVFQASIELSPFTKELLKEAISLRHGASHKTLVGKDGLELTIIEFDKYVGQIARQSQGNIGHALRLWVNGIKYKDDQHVQISEVMTYKFPNIISNDNGIVLSTLLIYRKLSEQEMESLLGPAYHEHYEQEIARLTGYGVIRRSYNGILSINDKVVPAITEALRQNRFI